MSILIYKEQLTSNLIYLKVDPQNLRSSYQKSGQYISLTLNKTSLLFSIANAPNALFWEFYIKLDGWNHTSFLSLKRGQALNISKAQGKGYSIKSILQKKNIFFIANGAGITAMGSLLTEMCHRNVLHQKKVFLFHSVRNEKDMFYRKEMAWWQQQGVAIVYTITQPLACWRGNTERVQKYLTAYQTLFASSSLVLCGSPNFEENIKQYFHQHSLTSDAIYQNY